MENEQTELIAAQTGSPGRILADPEQLQRIFDNLLENSKRHANVTPLKIRISLKSEKEGACVCFLDNGAGVPKEKLPYIFDEFYRGDESRNKKEGSGLGLYIVKYLTQAMGGSVRAENKGGLAVYLLFTRGEQAGCPAQSAS